jgi:cAMP phosphodiesterase
VKIRVLGNYGGVCSGVQLSTFLINDTLLIESVAAAFELTLEEQRKIRDILITHSHLDSIAGIFFLVDNVVSSQNSITLHSIKEVLDPIKRHILNNEIWPDFTKIPSPENPVLKLKEISEEKTVNIGSLEVFPVKVDHVVPTVGYILRDKNGTIVYTAESSPTNRIWEFAKKEKRLKALIIESSFPDSEKELARVSGHLMPKDLPGELRKFGRIGVPILLHNFKPSFADEVKRDIKRTGLQGIRLMEKDEVYEF